MTIPEALNLALRPHQAGRLQEAEVLYRQILQVEPNHPDALHLLGVLAHHDGRHQTRLRLGLRARVAASLCGAETFVHNLEQAYQAMWQRWCQG